MTAGLNVSKATASLHEHYMVQASKSFIGCDENEYKVKVSDIHMDM